MTLSKPINVLSELDKARIAMAIDTEGCITLHKEKNNCHRLVIRVSNTDKRLPIWLHTIIGAGNLTVRNNKRENDKTVFVWSAYSGVCRQLLPQLLSYFLVKDKQAELALSYMNLVYKRGKGLSTQEQAVKEEMLKRFTLLNKRGRKDSAQPERTYCL